MAEDDAHLVRSVLSGNQNDYRILVTRYEAAATQWALRYVKDPSRAEEIVQEAFVEAFFRLDRLREPEKFGSWFRSFVTYAAIAWLRQRKSTLLVGEFKTFDGGSQHYNRHEIATPYDDLEHQEQQESLQTALRAISPDYQEVIRMFYFEGCSHQQIAQKMNRSTSAIKSMLHRARQQLRKEMAGYE